MRVGSAVNIHAERLIGNELVSVKRRVYMGKVVGVSPTQVSLAGGGTIFRDALMSYDIVPPRDDTEVTGRDQ